MKKKSVGLLVILLCLTVLGTSGCFIKFKKSEPVEPDTGNETVDINLKESLARQSQANKFRDYGELEEFLKQGPVGRNVHYGGLAKGMITMDAMPTAAVNEVQASEVAGMGAGDDFSTTNIQVAGVDEADIIKNDGQYVYAVVKNDVYIMRAYPADSAEVLVKLAFKNQPQGLYVVGDRMVIYGRDQELIGQPIYRSFKRGASYTFAKVFDISEKANPKQIRDLSMEGEYFNSRLIGDYLYLVLNNYNFGYIADEPLLPRIFQNGEIVSNSCADGLKCFMPDVYHFNMPYESYNLTSLVSVNVKNKEQALQGELYLMPPGQNMYVSEDNIYLTYTKYTSEYQLIYEVYQEIIVPKLSAEQQAKVKEIQETPDYILNTSEKQDKINIIVSRYISGLSKEDADRVEAEMYERLTEKYKDIAQELEKTVVQKVAIKGGRMEYQGAGEVTGRVLNQFAMDEQDGFLRIATTKDRGWISITENQDESYSNVYVLDKNLKTVGALEKLALGEQIYAARFMQDRVYLVTFKQTDPLFVIDLKNNKDPKVLGELKIPGFSTYLHPYNDTILIGLGRDTTEQDGAGVVTAGIKLALFDVADVSAPKEITNYVLGGRGSESLALYDHKAFLFSREKNLLVIPAYLRDYTKTVTSASFEGAAVFEITDKKIELKGKIEHTDSGKPSNVFDRYGSFEVKRALYIKDLLYTFSDSYLKMNKLDNLELVKKLEIKKTGGEDIGDVEIIR